jgi:hypothetical protein
MDNCLGDTRAAENVLHKQRLQKATTHKWHRLATIFIPYSLDIEHEQTPILMYTRPLCNEYAQAPCTRTMEHDILENLRHECWTFQPMLIHTVFTWWTSCDQHMSMLVTTTRVSGTSETHIKGPPVDSCWARQREDADLGKGDPLHKVPSVMQLQPRPRTSPNLQSRNGMLPQYSPQIGAQPCMEFMLPPLLASLLLILLLPPILPHLCC